MTSKHTPGPWFCGCFRENGSGAGIDVGAENGSNVALCHHQASDRDACETKKNALLIAAAPDLLAALVGTLEYMYANIYNEPKVGTYAGDRMIAARAAIAKAKGE